VPICRGPCAMRNSLGWGLMNTIRRVRVSGCAIAVLLLVSACAPIRVGPPPVYSTVTVFHILPYAEQGASFAFIELPDQHDDLEYANYRDLIRSHLLAVGWVEATPTTALRLVTFSYAIDQGRVATVHVPVWGETGIASATTSGTYGYGMYSGTTTYTPSYGVTGTMPINVTQYSRVLRVEIANRPHDESTGPKRVYQADVVSVGRSGTLAPVMPAMIDALFLLFPGMSGQTRQETGTVR
jgi:hypothetical protein